MALDLREVLLNFAHGNEEYRYLNEAAKLLLAAKRCYNPSMFQASTDLLQDLPAYCEKHNLIGSLSNVSALLMGGVERLNWVGFYLYDGEKLRLGPFQGKPACTEIAVGKGVCGTAAQKRQTVRVDDVDAFPGHIACDSASKSEVVVPIVQNGKLFGVLDVDSPEKSRFTEQDEKFFEKIVESLIAHLDFSRTKD
jgi:GAF domain-containing protein